MIVSLIQMCLTDDLFTNMKKHEICIKNTLADLIVFPECSLTGYNIENLKTFTDENKYRQLRKAVKRIEKLSKLKSKTVIIGLPYLENGYLYNTGWLLTAVGKSSYYKKICLTVDEEKVFSRGEDIFKFKINDTSFGLLICRDQSSPYLFDRLKKEKIDYLIIQSAHYYQPEDALWKKYKNIAIPITRAMDYGLTVFKVNSVGLLGRKIAHGCSLAVNKEGKILGILGEFNEGILNINIKDKANEFIYTCSR